jgi:dTDP-4-amino-4,6-dideoxygalactose transaminase
MPSSNPVNLPIATRVTREILCLPIYAGLEKNDLDRVVALIKTHA